MKRIVSREACHDGKRSLTVAARIDAAAIPIRAATVRERLPFVETPIGAMGK
jgi:hypothetical protein